MKPIRYGPFVIIEQVGQNAFKLDLPPYMGIHPTFNVNSLKLFEPSMLDGEEDEDEVIIPPPKELISYV